MTSKELIDLLTVYVLPVVAVFLSVVFYIAGRDTAKRAESLLGEIRNASETWQRQIMAGAADLINSHPEIIGSKIFLAKIEASNKLSEAILEMVRDIANNPKQGEEAVNQAKNLKLLLDYQFHHFNTVIGGKPVPNASQSNLHQAP